MYKIIGADQKEYGPIDADQIRQWISEGRVNGQTQACLEGTQDWRPLETFPEFGFTAAQAARPVGTETAAPMTREEILARDYTLDIAACVSRGWGIFKTNFATLFPTFLLFVVLVIAAGGAIQGILAMIGVNRLPFMTKQYLSPVYSIFSSLVVGPALGGVFYVFLAVIRGQATTAGELFTGFKSFQDLFLGRLIPGLIYAACMFPYTISSATKMAPFFDGLQQNPTGGNIREILSHLSSGFSASLPIFLICLIPTMYLSVNWQFTLALVADKKMDFWNAMRTSWRMVHKHWFHVFGLVVVIGLINVVGFCFCCIGLLVTIPLGLAVLMCAYETIFGRQTA